MNADSTSADYGKTYLMVGRVNTAGTTTAGQGDGPIGPAGDAQTNNPWAIDTDGNGNIYWTESGVWRVRMATTGGSAMSFFTNGHTPSAAFSFAAQDVATVSPLTAGALIGNNNAAINTQAVVPAATGATQVQIDGPNSAITNACLPMRVRILNASNVVTNLSAPNTITLGGTNNAGGGYYSDAACTVALPGSQLSMAAGDSEADFYYKKTSNSASTKLTAVGTGLTSFPAAGIDMNVNASGVPAKFTVWGPSTYDYQKCMRLTVQIQSSGNQASLAGSARTFRMISNGTGTFHTDAACSSAPQIQFTIGAAQSQMFVYYSRTVQAPSANYAVTLVGTTASNNPNPGSAGGAGNVPISAGQVILQYPRGLAVWAPGFFVNNWDGHRTFFVNTTAATSYTIGGATVGGNQAVTVLGTGTGGFNSDTMGAAARVNRGYGLSLNPSQDTLLYPDHLSYRVRTLDLSTANGMVTTLIGAGRARFGHLGDAQTPATGMYMNGPSGMVLDDSGRKLYATDSANGRIRRIDLLTGYVDTFVGKGVGAANVENDDATNVFINSPRGLSMMTVSGAKVLIYTDQAAGAANQNCQLRAYNTHLTQGLAGFFGITLNQNRVSTIGGSYSNGCLTWGGVDGMAATSARLNMPEGLTNDGTNLYFAATNDHCIMKINSSGQISQHLGLCSTAGNGLVDGTNTSQTRLTYPTAVLIDPAYAADGNMFVADARDNTPSRVRYVNYRTSPVVVGSATIPAAPGGGLGITQTLWTISPSGNSRGSIYGLAAFDTQVCYAGGWPGDGGLGSHNVTCYDRSSPLGVVTLRVGPNEASGVPTRGGAPIDMTQEGILSSSALVNAPYGLAFDGQGNLYISERNNHIIRMVRRWW